MLAYHKIAIVAIFATLAACAPRKHGDAAGAGGGGSGGDGSGGTEVIGTGGSDAGHACVVSECFQPSTPCAYAICINDTQCGVASYPAGTKCALEDGGPPQGVCDGLYTCK